MVQAKKLSDVLVEFARTLATDFPIQGILDHLVERIVEILPVTGAGVTLISDGEAPQYIAASDASALRFERLQTEIGQGPCLAAYESGESVSVPDLTRDEAFPRFAPAAVEAGLAAVFTFPLRYDGGRLGALDLYRDTRGKLGRHDMEAAQTLADVATAYLLNAQARAEARETSDHFRDGALHDPLTGLPNRTLLQQRLEHAALRAKRSHSHCAILFADLDRFKQVNDTYGHEVGDALLRAVADRLSALLRPGDTLARLSGDEFVFLCEDLRDVSDAESVGERIDQAFSDPFTVGDIELDVTASVGTAFAGPGQDISTQLLFDADFAMYQIKREGAGGRTVDLRDTRLRNDLQTLQGELRSALDQDNLDVAYQPIVRTSDGLVVGVEALLRWVHPVRGNVSPLSMVAAAERGGLIGAIGAWVMERACTDRRQWMAENPGVDLDLAVNISGRQLMNGDLRATVQDVLERTGTDPKALVLEITESVLIEDGERSLAVLGDLKALGVRLALDDFGTGYSSLSYLRRMPIDIVKIDQSFVAGIEQTQGGNAIIAAVTHLAHALGLVVIAEGVETERQRDEVHAIGCDFAQGYLYSHPIAGPVLSAQFKARDTSQPHLPAAREAETTVVSV